MVYRGDIPYMTTATKAKTGGLIAAQVFGLLLVLVGLGTAFIASIVLGIVFAAIGIVIFIIAAKKLRPVSAKPN